MKRLALACAAVVLLGAAVFAIVRLSGRGAAQAERAAAQPAVQDSPAAEVPEPAGAPAPAGDGAARDRDPAAPRDTPVAAPAEPHADDGAPLQLPPDIDVAPIVEAIERMAAGGPASRAQARELSLVLAKYNVPLPRVLSELVAAEEEKTTQPTAEEIGELREPNLRIADMLGGQLSTLTLTAPDALERFYMELLSRIAHTSSSRSARMMAACFLVRFASPPQGTLDKPLRSGGDATVTRRAVAAALAFMLEHESSHSDEDLAQALWLYFESIMPSYLMLSVLDEPQRRSKPVDPLVMPFISKAQELAHSELHPTIERMLNKVLDDLRSHLGKDGRIYCSEVDRRRDIQAFFDELAGAINAEDKRALTEMMHPEMADAIAAADSLRDKWGRAPNVEEVRMKVVGGIMPWGRDDDAWRVQVYISAVTQGNHGEVSGRIVEYRLGRRGQDYRILDPR